MQRTQVHRPSAAHVQPITRYRPRRRSIAAAGAIVVLAALSLSLLSCSSGDGDTSTTGSTAIPTTTSATAPVTTAQPSTTVPPTSITAPPSAGAPGDSAGSWVETPLPALPPDAHAVSVSDQALLVAARTDAGASLWAYLFDKEKPIELPVSGSDVFRLDIDGLLAVWWEGTFVEGSGSYADQHVYAYLLPDGPKVDVTGDKPGVDHPQVAGEWITWTEGTPSDDLPDEYWRMPLFGVKIDPQGEPQGEPVELMGSVIAAVAGDSFFTYSLSETHLAWEQGRDTADLALGTHVMDLETLQPTSLGKEAWRPSIGGDTLVYHENGLKARDLASEKVSEIDPRGDYVTAAPTFAAYYRAPEAGGYEIVARGLTGGYEQVLGAPTDVPYLSPAIAASAGHVAFITGGAVKLFAWQGR